MVVLFMVHFINHWVFLIDFSCYLPEEGEGLILSKSGLQNKIHVYPTSLHDDHRNCYRATYNSICNQPSWVFCSGNYLWILLPNHDWQNG